MVVWPDIIGFACVELRYANPRVLIPLFGYYLMIFLRHDFFIYPKKIPMCLIAVFEHGNWRQKT